MYNFREISPDEFQKFALQQKTRNFLQSYEMFSRYSRNGTRVRLAGVFREEELVLGALIQRVKTRGSGVELRINGGPLVDYSRTDLADILRCFLAGLKKHSRERERILISPNLAYNHPLAGKLEDLGFVEIGEFGVPKWVCVLDLVQIREQFGSAGKTADEKLLQSFKRACRQNIRYSLNRYDVRIREITKNDLSIFYSFCLQAAEKHHFRTPQLEYFTEMSESFGPKQVKFLVAYYQDTPIAAGMWVLYGDEVIYLYSGMDYDYGKYYGAYALQWKMIRYARDYGFKRYNFYGTRPINEDGVFKFKTGFRAEPLELMGTFYKPLNLGGKLLTTPLRYRKFGELV